MISVILIALLLTATLLCAAWTLYLFFTRTRKHTLLCTTILVLSASLTTAAVLRHVGLYGENFRAVRELECYRSSQLSAQALRRRVQENGIKTVINLRGASPKEWYRLESATLQSLGVDLLNISLNNQRLPRPERLTMLIHALKTAQRPILLHCNHGVDRTGFAAVLYEAIVARQPLDAAIANENSMCTGHFETQNNNAGDRVFELYRSSGSELSFEQWTRTDYTRWFTQQSAPSYRVVGNSWLNAPLRIGGLSMTPFKALGILGASLFACRWFVQAYYSRRAGRPVTPLNFWLISILGSALMLIYFCFSPKQDIVGIISNLFPAAVSAYNVFLELRHRARERMALELRQASAELQSVS